jgi:hypothetical protein
VRLRIVLPLRRFLVFRFVHRDMFLTEPTAGGIVVNMLAATWAETHARLLTGGCGKDSRILSGRG